MHAIHNPSEEADDLPGDPVAGQVAKGPFLVDCYNDEPWRSLRKPFVYPEVDPRTGLSVNRISPADAS